MALRKINKPTTGKHIALIEAMYHRGIIEVVGPLVYRPSPNYKVLYDAQEVDHIRVSELGMYIEDAHDVGWYIPATHEEIHKIFNITVYNVTALRLEKVDLPIIDEDTPDENSEQISEINDKLAEFDKRITTLDARLTDIEDTLAKIAQAGEKFLKVMKAYGIG
jgi:hypothetical protein